MKSNTMRVNGKEEEWTDSQMRDWYSDGDHANSHDILYYTWESEDEEK